MKIFSLAIAIVGLGAMAYAAAPTGKVSVGAAAPTFDVKDTNGKTVNLEDLKGKFVVLEWSNYGCPYVKKHYGTGNMQSLQKKYTQKGVVWLTIFSSGEGSQGAYSNAELNKMAADRKASSRLISDTDGTLGKEYGAKNTPTMFVIDPTGKVIYMGAIDDKPTSDPEDVATAKNYVAAALDEAMAGKAVTTPVSRPYGCGIKYKD